MNKNSLAAYRSIGAHLDSHYFLIYEALLLKGPQNCWQIANTTWDIPNNGDNSVEVHNILMQDQVYRRVSEMVKAGWIQKLDWETKTKSGCYASVYWISTKGKK